MGLVTVTSIWSMGKTPLSMPTTMRGKFVSGKTETGMVSARYAPTAIRVRMTKMMGLPWREVQCGASGWVTGSLIGIWLGLVFLLALARGRFRRGILVFVRGFLHRGVDHLDLGLVVQADAAPDDHLFADR